MERRKFLGLFSALPFMAFIWPKKDEEKIEQQIPMTRKIDLIQVGKEMQGKMFEVSWYSGGEHAKISGTIRKLKRSK